MSKFTGRRLLLASGLTTVALAVSACGSSASPSTSTSTATKGSSGDEDQLTDQRIEMSH